MIGAITAGLLTGGAPAVTNSYESIQTITVPSGGSASVSFTSIPSGFKHLQVRGIGKSTYNDGGTDSVYLFMTYNGDASPSNYQTHWLAGNGSSAFAAAYNVHAGIIMHMLPKTNSSINYMYGTSIIDVLDYGDTHKNKTSRALTGGDLNNSYGLIGLESGLWLNTAAITSLTLTPSSGSFAEFSQYALYGIKG